MPLFAYSRTAQPRRPAGRFAVAVAVAVAVAGRSGRGHLAVVCILAAGLRVRAGQPGRSSPTRSLSRDDEGAVSAGDAVVCILRGRPAGRRSARHGIDMQPTASRIESRVRAVAWAGAVICRRCRCLHTRGRAAGRRSAGHGIDMQPTASRIESRVPPRARRPAKGRPRPQSGSSASVSQVAR
jgi:hypothetical protein